MTKAIRRAIKSGGQEALAIARESRNKAVELRDKFRDAGGDEAIVRAKENVLSKTRLALLAAQRQADRLAESQAVHNFYHHPVVVKVGNSAVVKKSKYAIVVGKERTIALARKGKQRCIAAREHFREAGGDEAVIRAREKILATTKRLAISARDELGKLRRSRVLLRSGWDDPTNEKEAVRDRMPS